MIKSQRLLRLKRGGEVLHSYRVALGSGGPGYKNGRGDKRTPEGVYRIMQFVPDSRFHYFMQIDYPNRTDAWRAYLDGTIGEDDYLAIVNAHRHKRLPPQRTALGGQIGLHGIGSPNTDKALIHLHYNWTQGCIALTNEEIRELRRYVRIGTRLLVRE